MQYLHKKETSSMSEFAYKIRSEELALSNQIKKYKLNYLTKVIEKSNIANFIRFSRELFILVISYCKNIIYVAPQKLSITIQELTVLFDDLLKKYHDVFLKYHQIFQEQCTSEARGNNISELCEICGQQMKKVNIDKIKTYILNQIELSWLEKDGSENQKPEDDALFFAEVNNLLTIKQGELLKNQIQINNYKEIALNALTYLTTMKDYFSRESLIMPNSSWLDAAKQEMQVVLKQTFQDKIPPWIAKMLNAFWVHYQEEIEKKRCQVGAQTENNIQLEIIQLRKKVIVGKQKLLTEENLVKAKQKQLVVVKGQKDNLEGKIEYYKNQVNKLIEEIENSKMENQILKRKLNNPKSTRTIEKNETEKESLSQSQSYISRENIGTSRKTQKLRAKANIQTQQEKILPKIKGRQQPKKSKQMQRTSIKVNMSATQSPRRLQQTKKSIKRIQKNSNVVLGSKNKSEQSSLNIIDTNINKSLNEGYIKSKKTSNNFTDFSVEKSVIRQQGGELNLQEYKLKIRQVDQHLKSAVKNGVFLKNGQKHFESSIIHNAQLKRVPRQTIKIEQLNKSHSQLKNLGNTLKRKNNNALKLSKIYTYLKDLGYLIKISQTDFKDSIQKIKKTNQDQEQKASSFSQTKRNKLNNKKNLIERGLQIKKSIHDEWDIGSQSQHRYNNSLEKSLQQSIARKYLMLFMSIHNAYIYETNSIKNHSKHLGKLDNIEQEMCQSLFVLINQLKIQNTEYYNSLCSFIKFPYQVISNSLGSLNITNHMKYNNFYNHFQRILIIHYKCKKSQGLCNHIRQFKIKLVHQHQIFRKQR